MELKLVEEHEEGKVTLEYVLNEQEQIWFEELAAERGITVNQVVKEALNAYFTEVIKNESKTSEISGSAD